VAADDRLEETWASPVRRATGVVHQARVPRGAVVTISVPRGEEMATQSTNARGGLLGDISILA
jgi:cobalamin biosynthesis protein CbiD